MKKFLVTALCVAMVCSVFSGCSTKSTTSEQGQSLDSSEKEISSEQVPEVPVKLNFIANLNPATTDLNENTFLKEMAKNVNAEITYECTFSEWDVKKSTILASNDLPDAFVTGGITTQDISSNLGLFEKLDDFIKENAPTIQSVLDNDETLRKTVTDLNGDIYYLTGAAAFMPAVYTSMSINQKWLDKLGLPMPSTTKELEKTLIAFRDNDPNGNSEKDEIPMYMDLKGDEAWSIRAFTGAFDCTTSISSWFALRNGKLEYQPITENYKEYMTWISGLREQGLMPEELATADWSQRAARCGSEIPIVGVTNCWIKDPINIAYQDDYVTLPPLKGPNGAQYIAANSDLTHYDPNPKFVMCSSSKNKELIIKFMDQFFKPENGIQMESGVLGTSIELKDGIYSFTTPPEGMDWDTWTYKNSCRGNWAAYVPVSFEANFSGPSEAAAQKLEIEKVYTPFIKEGINVPSLKFTEEQINELSIVQTDVENYVNKMIVEWFANGKVGETWDNYLSELKNMGVDKYIEIYKEAYDAQK